MSRRRGIAVVEFSLGATLLFGALAGTFEIGFSLLQYDTLQGAVAQAARYAAIAPYDSATTAPSTAFLNSVKNMAVYGNPAGGTTPILHGLTTQNVNLTVTFSNGVPYTMKLFITGYTINALFSTYSLSGKPQAIFPYQGVWAPD